MRGYTKVISEILENFMDEEYQNAFTISREERLRITYVKGASSCARSRFPRKKRPDKGARNIPY